MKQVTPVIGDAFVLVDKGLWETFVLAPLEGLGEGEQEQGVTCLPVKQAGLALTNPTLTAPENWTASCVITGHLVAELRGQVKFWTSDHSTYLRKGYTEV